MIHRIEKDNIFNFLKEKSVIQEVSEYDTINILEDSKGANLKEVILNNLDITSKYWILNSESKTFLEMQGRKVEKIILEQTHDDILNIIMIELKSEKIGNKNKILEKFKNSLSWVYLLLNLLDGKERGKIRVFGVLISQEKIDWNEKSTLNILSSTSIRYIKRSFYTSKSSIVINIDRLKDEIETKNDKGNNIKCSI